MLDSVPLSKPSDSSPHIWGAGSHDVWSSGCIHTTHTSVRLLTHAVMSCHLYHDENRGASEATLLPRFDLATVSNF